MKILSKIKSFALHPIWHYSPSKILALVKADWNDELVPLALHEQLRKDMAELVSGQVTIHDIAIRNGTIGMEMSTELARIMAESWLAHLNQMKAENYLEFGFKLRGQIAECIVVTVQRTEGKSPHLKRLDAEKQRDALLEIADWMISRVPTEAPGGYCQKIGIAHAADVIAEVKKGRVGAK